MQQCQKWHSFHWPLEFSLFHSLPNGIQWFYLLKTTESMEQPSFAEKWFHWNHHLIYIVFSNIFALSIELHKNAFWYIHSIESAFSLFSVNVGALGMTKCDFVKYLCHCLIERLSELIYLFLITFFHFLI